EAERYVAAIEPAFERAHAQQRGRVVPRTARKRVEYVATGQTDIGEHAVVGAREQRGITAMRAPGRKLFGCRDHTIERGRSEAGQRRGKRGPGGRGDRSHDSLLF